MTMSAKEVALELGTDPRTLRKFLRATTPTDEHPGQGGRWNFEKGQVKKLKKQFTEWSSNSPKPSTNGKTKAAAEQAIADVEEVTDDDVLEELDALEGPSDNELIELEEEDIEEI